MDVAEYIQENLNPLEILNHYGFKNIKESETEIRACCAIHNGNNPSGFVWNKQNNLWFCYTGECGGGDVFTLVQKIEHIGFVDAVKKIANILGLDINGIDIVANSNRIIKEQRDWLARQMKIHTKVNKKEYTPPYTKYSMSCENFSRFDEKTLQHFGAKFCTLYPLEDSMLYNKLVIPLTQNNVTIGAALRDTTGHFMPKWYYVPKGIKINDFLYNLDTVNQMIDTIQEVILVEGIFDVWAYHNIGIDNVLAIFGSSIKDEQYKMLLKLGLNIVLSFDNDKAGQKCTKTSKALFNNKTTVKTIELPEGKDPADCTQEELLSAYMNRT